MQGEVRRWLAGQIARRQARGESCRAIGRTLGIARKTVRTLIAEETLRLATGASALARVAKPPRVPRRSKLDRFQTRIDFWLTTHKGLTAVRLHELLREEGFQGGLTIVRDRLTRPTYNNRDLESDLTFQTAVADLYRCMFRGKSYCAALTALSWGNVRNKPFVLDQAERKTVVDAGRRGHYSQWRTGVAVEMSALGIGSRTISHVLSMSRTTLRKVTAAHRAHGLSASKKRNPKAPRPPIGLKAKQILEILHQKPLAFNINRSNWNRPALAQAYESTYGQRIGLSTIGDLLMRSGYTIKKARRVLMSPDPEYREKVEQVLNTLQNLKPDELFFFIDELGPLRVKKYGRRYKDIEAICDAAKKGRVYPSFSQCKLVTGSLSSASPNLDEATAAGAVLDKAITGLFANEGAAIEILMKVSGDTVLRKDLRRCKGNTGFIPGFSLLGEAEQREALLMTAIGEPDPVVSRRFLIGRADTTKLRSALTSRYQALFSWLQEFRRAALANGFAEYSGNRKYLAGLRSSDVDKRNRAVRSAVRWLARY